MIRRFSALIITSMLCACSPSAEETVQSEPVQLTGKQAYDKVCADCHNEGINGAPRIGDKEAWKDRSQLWNAVLFEHAKSGFLDMPAKGGSDELTDATVARAAEYMLTRTFPNINRD